MCIYSQTYLIIDMLHMYYSVGPCGLGYHFLKQLSSKARPLGSNVPFWNAGPLVNHQVWEDQTMQIYGNIGWFVTLGWKCIMTPEMDEF